MTQSQRRINGTRRRHNNNTTLTLVTTRRKPSGPPKRMRGEENRPGWKTDAQWANITTVVQTGSINIQHASLMLQLVLLVRYQMVGTTITILILPATTTTQTIQLGKDWKIYYYFINQVKQLLAATPYTFLQLNICDTSLSITRHIIHNVIGILSQSDYERRKQQLIDELTGTHIEVVSTSVGSNKQSLTKEGNRAEDQRKKEWLNPPVNLPRPDFDKLPLILSTTSELRKRTLIGIHENMDLLLGTRLYKKYHMHSHLSK